MALGPPHDGLAVTALGPLQEWSASVAFGPSAGRICCPWPLAHCWKGKGRARGTRRCSQSLAAAGCRVKADDDGGPAKLWGTLRATHLRGHASADSLRATHVPCGQTACRGLTRAARPAGLAGWRPCPGGRLPFRSGPGALRARLTALGPCWPGVSLALGPLLAGCPGPRAPRGRSSGRRRLRRGRCVAPPVEAGRSEGRGLMAFGPLLARGEPRPWVPCWGNAWDRAAARRPWAPVAGWQGPPARWDVAVQDHPPAAPRGRSRTGPRAEVAGLPVPGIGASRCHGALWTPCLRSRAEHWWSCSMLVHVLRCSMSEAFARERNIGWSCSMLVHVLRCSMSGGRSQGIALETPQVSGSPPVENG